MASRLDKLYELLESNNVMIRSAAAVQIGQISGSCQLQLHSLLNKLLPYIKHKNWSVRVSAADALKQIGKCTKLWIPNGSIVDIKYEEEHLISLDKLNLLEILKIGTRLYSTDILELEGGEVDASVNKEQINKHLGLLIPGSDIGLVVAEDFGVYVSHEEGLKVSVAEAVGSSLGDSVAARKRLHEDDEEGPKSKIQCATEIQDEGWPWADLCSDLLISLWHPKWEVRHGAATALREVIRSQGTLMVKSTVKNVSKEEFARCHSLFMDDVLGRILCTLALDQLSDFVNDEMVAPVRESCAQCLGLATVHLPRQVVLIVTRHLLVLLDHCEWTVTHGALLGLKYVLASRLDMLDMLLPLVYDSISSHLRDSRDDDVRCAAASAMMSIFSQTTFTLPRIDQLDALRSDLWMVLGLRQDYTSPGATGAVLHLLEKLYSRDITVDKIFPPQSDISSYLNRLHWCYYNYGEAVRIAAVRTCEALVRHYRCRLNEILPQTMLQVLAQLYQRVLIDDSVKVVTEAEQLWKSIVDELSADRLALCCIDKLDLWMCCAMQPARLSFSLDILVLPHDESNDLADSKHQLPLEFFIGGRESYLVDGSSNVRSDAVLVARLAACRCMAHLCARLSSLHSFDEHIIGSVLTQVHLKERLALQRFVGASILSHWKIDSAWIEGRSALLSPLRAQLIEALEEPIYYQELLPQFKQMIKSCRHLITAYNENKISLPGAAASAVTLNLPQCQSLVTNDLYNRLHDKDPNSDSVFSCARTSVEVCVREHGQLTRLVEVSLARALLSWGWLPDRLTPLIKPLMDTVRIETRSLLQLEASKALSLLVVDRVAANIVAPIGKLIRNLVTYLSDSIDCIYPLGQLQGILSLHKVAQIGKQLPPVQEQLPEDSLKDNVDVVKMRGSRMALEQICLRMCGEKDASVSLPLVLEVIFHQPMRELRAKGDRGAILAGLRSMEACLPTLKRHCAALKLDIREYGHCVVEYGLCHEDMALRHWSARVIAILAMPVSDEDDLDLCRYVVDSLLLAEVLPSLDKSRDERMCQGAIELLYLLMQQGLFEYRLSLVVLLLPTVLRSLNSSTESVRSIATLLFSLLLSFMPLELHGANLSLLTSQRQDERHSSRDFIDGLLKPDSISSYDVSHCIRVPLRHYQQLGVNWLAFLNRYGLHGVLADDMGLGKTLQTLSIIAGECSREPGTPMTSLVVCPPTLTAHWQQEICKHVSQPGFSTLLYTGSTETRLSLARTFAQYNIVVTSYDILRNDADRLERPSAEGPWHYLVLDEGHLIRNHKSKLAQAAKSISARHRLMLTGTPIQNRVAELWSLFDFLMPGLLGTHSDFQRHFGRVLSHTASSSGKRVDSEAATLALEGLHKQVLPFMLRRVKEEVLQELPPKIMQDYVCHMTALQSRLYSAFLGSSAGEGLCCAVEGKQELGVPLEERRHVFQALHYLRLVCNHPSLALQAAHPLYNSVKQDLASHGQSLDDVDLSGKLVSLRQLILDCGVGRDDDCADLLGPSGLVSSHRLLLFCQSRAMVLLVEKMLVRHLPRASFLRMDGSVAVRDRQNIITTFNEDPSVDLLLLTTGVGGLGLNLTAADTVIFVEHDWNPMRDLQAMDRAHRLGQARNVNVYRLITADSIEEKIMNLQQFKMFVANSVVGGDNKQLASMYTESVLDIMNKEAAGVKGPSAGPRSQLGRAAAEVADEYGEEYDLDSFVRML